MQDPGNKMGVRIIGGELKGKRLYSIRGTAIRPTADRLRESVFNILFSCIRDAIVLDLFAGTGAYGIEALSRGAESAVFIDNNKAAISAIKKNLASCAYDNRVRIINWDIRKNLNCLNFFPYNRFNLIFLDPPYDLGMVDLTLSHLGGSDCMAKEALVIVEHSDRETISKERNEFAIKDQRRYGKTLVSFLAYGI
jgi:16S rRNA (guanine966-N2)-methyltransferase